MMGSIIMTDYLMRCIFAIIRVIYNLCNSRSSVTLYLVDIALAAVVLSSFLFPYPLSRVSERFMRSI